MIRRLLAVALIVAAVAVAGCADDGDDTGDGPAGTGEVPADEAATAGDEAGDGRRPVDPSGRYVLDVGADWVTADEASPVPADVWFLPSGTEDVVDNVTVTAEAYDGDLEGYLEVAVASRPVFLEDGVEEAAEIVERADGGELGVLRYSGTVVDADLGFVSYVMVDDGHAVTATLAAEASRFDEVRSEVEPYLSSLRPGTPPDDDLSG